MRVGHRNDAILTAAGVARVAAPPLPPLPSECELPDAEEPDMNRNEQDPGKATREGHENSCARPATAGLASQGATAQRVEKGALLLSNAQ